jgi:hypothetical protein
MNNEMEQKYKKVNEKDGKKKNKKNKNENLGKMKIFER